MNKPRMARSLTSDERRVLGRLLSAWEGGDPYLAQLGDVHVVGGCQCGCVTVYFQHEDASGESEPSLPLPVEGDLSDEYGTPSGGVLLFAGNGRLSALEAYSLNDDPVRVWPPDEQIRVTIRGEEEG